MSRLACHGAARTKRRLRLKKRSPGRSLAAIFMCLRFGRGRITADRTRQFFAQIATFDFLIAPAPSVADFARLSLLASRFQLTSYDTAYLDLSKRLALPLATLDEDLQKAALAEGVTVL
jgi:predicted nucleic acid-binding protein